VTALTHSTVDVKTFYKLKQIQDDAPIQSAVIFDNCTQQETIIPVDAVLMNLGFKAGLGPIKTWGLALKGSRYVQVNARLETNLPGAYAAGDIAAPEDAEPINLIAAGFSQAALAINMAATFVNPQAKIFPGHSSEKL
jgi:thioredoxin reductase (NADPH)